MDSKNIEWQALLFFCKEGLLNSQEDNLHQPDLSLIDWDKLHALAIQHRVRPLLYKGIVQKNFSYPIPKSFTDRLQLEVSAIAMSNLHKAKGLTRLITLFKKENIEILPYKGVILALEAYGDIGAREFVDIDFLFSLEDFKKMGKVLEENGFEPETKVKDNAFQLFFKLDCEYNYDIIENGKRILHVEPHWKVGLNRYQTNLKYQDFLTFTEYKNLLGVNFRSLTPEGLLLTTVLHHSSRDRWNKLKYTCDVAAILLKFQDIINWELLLTESKKHKVKNLVLFGVGLAASIFDLNLPKRIKELINDKFLKEIESISQDIEYLVHFNSSPSRIVSQSMLFHFKIREQVSSKLKIIYYHFLRIIIPYKFLHDK